MIVLLQVLLLCIGVVTAQENQEEPVVISQSLCMDGFLAVNMEKVIAGVETNLVSHKLEDMNMCYQYLENYREKIHGFNIYSVCFVDDDFLFVNKAGKKINRCGQWLQLVGPSQKPVICMIAGTHGLKSDYYEGAPIIGLQTSLFEGLTPGMTSATNIVTPITVAETDFDLRINPSLYVTYTKEGYNYLHFVNINRPSEMIAMEGMEYNIGEDNRFKIPYKEKRLVTISLISFDRERIDFLDVDLDNHSEEITQSGKETMEREFLTQSRFVNNVVSHCNYLAENHIYNKGGYKKNQFLRWTISKTNVDAEGKPLDENQEPTYYSNEHQDFIVDVDSEHFSISFALTPSATVFSSSFKYLELIMKANFDANDFIHVKSTMTPQEGSNEIQALNKLANVDDVPTKYYINSTTNEISIKVAFRKNNRIYAEALTIFGKIDKWDQHNGKDLKLDVLSATLIRKDEFAEQVSCDPRAFDCLNTECTMQPEDFVPGVSPWESPDCLPVCGTCSVGYKCNAEGKCAKIENKNTRSSTSSMIITFFCVLMMLVM